MQTSLDMFRRVGRDVVAIAPEGLGAGSDLHGLEPTVPASSFSDVGRVVVVPKGAFAARATSCPRRSV